MTERIKIIVRIINANTFIDDSLLIISRQEGCKSTAILHTYIHISTEVKYQPLHYIFNDLTVAT